MKKIFLYAYTRLNLGDDLFIHMITNRYPDVQFYMWSDCDNLASSLKIRNLKFLNLDGRVLRAAKRIRPSLSARIKDAMEKSCQAVVYIGGSIFIEYDNWEQILSWWEYEAVNRKFYVLGANFGPYLNGEYKERHRQLFEKMQDVCFRDQYSKALFADVKSVRCAPDILFAYEMPKTVMHEKNIFVSLIDCSSKSEGRNQLSEYQNVYIQGMAALVKEYLDAGYSVTFASFCKYEGDNKAIDDVLKKADLLQDDAGINILTYDGSNSSEITNAIAGAELIIASRFHAAILGFAAGKPVLPIVYSDKTVHVLQDAGFEGDFWDIREIENENSNIKITNVERQKLNNLSALRSEAEAHFEGLDILLKSC